MDETNKMRPALRKIAEEAFGETTYREMRRAEFEQWLFRAFSDGAADALQGQEAEPR